MGSKERRAPRDVWCALSDLAPEGRRSQCREQRPHDRASPPADRERPAAGAARRERRGDGWSDAHARPVSCPPCLQGEEHFHSRTHPALRKRTWLTRHARIRTETSISYKGKKGKLRGTTTFPATISTKRGLSEGSSILHCKLSLEFNFTQGEIPAKQNKTFAWRDYDSKLYKGENVDGQTTSLLSEASYQQ